VDWEAGEAVERLGEPIRALSLFQQGSDILLFVGTTSTAPKTRILMSHDLHTWSPLTDLPHSVCGAGHFTTDYGSKHARGNVAFVVSPSQPAVVQARWGDEWADAAAWTNQAPVAEVGPGSAILDAFVKPTLGEAQFALIADVRQRGAPDEPAPFYALSQDSARYEALQPLAFATPTPPRQIRVYARARHFWLVTYLRRLDGRDRLFWGTIDWEKEPLTLEEIDMAAALDEAFYVVGLK
jgi:hypothetical protein